MERVGFEMSTEVAASIQAQTLVVRSVQDAAHGVRLLKLTSPFGGALPTWEPGAHIDVFIPGIGARQYSLCGDPLDLIEWSIAVQLEREGRGGSAWVHRVEPGTMIAVGAPRNHFALAPAEKYFFIAGGIGVTPILSMVRSMPSSANWKLLYGGRSLRSMAFSSDLQALGGDRVKLCPQDTAGFPDLAAYLEDVDLNSAVYVCGPPGMLKAIEGLAKNWPRGTLHTERFAARQDGVSIASTFDVVLARSNRTVSVKADESIVDALSRVGVRVTTVCKEGVCGTCETAVLGGTPDHRDSILSPDERAAGNTMMICCSRALTDRLVLDL